MTFNNDFSRKLASGAGIVDLMADLGHALNVNPDMLFLGGGNPAYVPEFEHVVGKSLQAIAADPDELHKLIGIYQSPQGDERFLANLAGYFQSLGWPISERNICLTGGSQTAFFMLINMLAGSEPGLGVDVGGDMDEGADADSDAHSTQKHICLPLVPEYLGYADQGIAESVFRTVRPIVELVGDHEFRYRCDFDALQIDSNTAAICLSRPTNPSGNMLADEEIQKLSELADEHGIPLIIDCAYGDPFPGLVYGKQNTRWRKNTVFVFSLSKLGLPAVRTGIVVADEAIINALVNANTVISLANGNLGPALMNSMLEKGELTDICENTLQPFYRAKRQFALDCIAESMQGINYRVHAADGAFFLWLWFPELQIDSSELYERLKQRDVLVMDGSHFFFEHAQSWPHAKQCIRISYCADTAVLAQAIDIIAEELLGSVDRP